MLPELESRRAAMSIRFAVRAAGLLGVWMLLIGPSVTDLAVGAPTAVAAAWISLALRPPGALRPRFARLAALALRVPLQSIAAGFDIARRALHPRLPLRPGYVSHPVRLPPGLARDLFAALTSVVPGSVPSGDDGRGAMRVHCLDLDLPVAANLAADEARVARVFGANPDV
jgi:multicomponent Na+:H+ antiporter subunit E